MKIVAWVILGVLGISLLALLYYLVVGEILFRFALGKKNLKQKKRDKQIKKKAEEYNIDLDWWKVVDFQKVNIQNEETTLVGHYLNQHSGRSVILVHGYCGDYQEMQPYAKYFYTHSYNVLCVENRAHGESGGECVGMGYLDRLDVIKWIEYLNSKKVTDIVLFGISMGAVAVCCAAGEELPLNVKCVVADSPFESTVAQIGYVIKKYKVFGKVMLKHLLCYAKHTKKIDLMQWNTIRCIQNIKLPTLYIHGKADRYVSPKSSLKLYNSTPSNLRELYLVDGAEHIKCYKVAGNMYEKKINMFFNKYKVFK